MNIYRNTDRKVIYLRKRNYRYQKERQKAREREKLITIYTF